MKKWKVDRVLSGMAEKVPCLCRFTGNVSSSQQNLILKLTRLLPPFRTNKRSSYVLATFIDFLSNVCQTSCLRACHTCRFRYYIYRYICIGTVAVIQLIEGVLTLVRLRDVGSLSRRPVEASLRPN